MDPLPEPRSSESPKPPSWSEWKDWIGKRWWLYPFAGAEWASEWVYYGLRRLAFFDLLELAGRAAVLVVVILWFLEADDRAKERHYRAWELINAAAGKAGDGGRRDALQDLNNDRVSLEAAPLERAHLPQIDLRGAHLTGADLRHANLWGAHLQDAHLPIANLQSADLQRANLQDAHLQSADLRHANLWGAHLQGTNLEGANLAGADLENADLQRANLWGAHLQGISLMRAKLRGANLASADLHEARNLTQEQLNTAFGDDQTQLPDGLTRPAHWRKAGGSESPPAAQPDEAGEAPAADGAPGSDK